MLKQTIQKLDVKACFNTHINAGQQKDERENRIGLSAR
jgi:hypothetical protein